jgi:general secretion pathway protein A
LRQFDLPAILDLKVPPAGKAPVALVALGQETATLALAGQEYTFPLREVDALWDGAYTLLWKVPPFGVRLVSLGMRGKDVGWLRSKLDELEGKETKVSRPEIYDEALQQRIRDFQRSRSLVPDGVVGEETVVQLVLATRDPGTPSLSRQSP